MDRLKFGHFIWQQNPEEFHVDAVTETLYQLNNDGTAVYKGLGPLCRVISGKGVFQGESAVKYFNALSVKMAAKNPESLIHPIWGSFSVYLIELNMMQNSRPDYIEYRFVFREADESGMIPRLPEKS